MITCRALQVPIWAKDPLMTNKKFGDGQTMPLEQAQQDLLQEEENEEEKEHLSNAQLRARRKRSEPTKSVVPIAMVDPKGKNHKGPTKKAKEEEEEEKQGSLSRGRTKGKEITIIGHACGQEGICTLHASSFIT